MELTQDGLVNYLGKYDYYVEKKQEMIQSGKKYMAELKEMTEATGEEPVLSSAEQRRLQKEKEAEERRLRRRKESLEEEIALLEEEIEALETELTKPAIMADYKKLAEINDNLTAKKQRLEECYEQWVAL